jgi:Tetrapyrrole (Corrin/Porphyrin) Methylases
MDRSKYPTFEEHRASWNELARGIASLRNQVREVRPGEIAPNFPRGELIVIGSGIETVGFTLGDQELIESAGKVLFCVADPATIVWLKRLRPDALDLYVLYGEDKLRYTTYMQMTEAQLYWVRQGLKVVVVFYGHPGIFVLATHRAIKIARSEGYKATMKANVSALDTLCADLGVDPAHPGLQTHEATDALVRQRTPDTSLHVVLWQVGVIGELGYRRHGYLNNHFSYFIGWLQGIYGDDYEVTHYIGSRYPTIAPLIEKLRLSELHDPERQLKITGISTFYLPPRDVRPSDLEVMKHLGLIRKGQRLVTPSSPLREIGLYGPKEMKAFDAFAAFKIPSSYTWQDETGASRFLIELRFDPELQERYEQDPLAAVSDPRFAYLTDKERAMLSSRDSGTIQIACKGAYERSVETEQCITEILTKRESARSLVAALRGLRNGGVSRQFNCWLEKKGFTIERRLINKSIDYIHRNALYPWTGIYLEPQRELLLTIIGNRRRRTDSIVYVNGERIQKFTCNDGCVKWKAGPGNAHNGLLRPDLDLKGNRRIIGKIWTNREQIPARNNFTADEIDPERESLAARVKRFCRTNDFTRMSGEYIVRISGQFPGSVDRFSINGGLAINNKAVEAYRFANGVLSWSKGDSNCYSGEIRFLLDPILNSVELFGTVSPEHGQSSLKCQGSSVVEGEGQYFGPQVPAWAETHLAGIVRKHSANGGLLLWHKWEKQNYTSMVVNKLVAKLS